MLIWGVLVLVAAAHIATPSWVQATTDGDVGIVLSHAALTIDEGGTATYTVALSTRPSGNVNITFWRSSYDIVFRQPRGPRRFTPENWKVPQTVTLAAVHDDDADDGAVVVTPVASGGGYDGVSGVTLEVTVVDDDDAGLGSLTLEGVALDESFDPTRTSYTATVEHAVSAVTIEATGDHGANLTMPEDDAFTRVCPQRGPMIRLKGYA